MTNQGPYIVSEPPLISGGVDFLGLRQTNLDLMAEAIPGVNNVTRYVRPFSLMAWITWKYRDLVAGIPRAAHDKMFPGFRERAETLFTWSHWINGRRDLVGMRSSILQSAGMERRRLILLLGDVNQTTPAILLRSNTGQLVKK